MNLTSRCAVLLVIATLLASVTIACADVQVDLAGSPIFDAGNDVWEYTYTINNTTGANYVYYMVLSPVDNATITGFPSGWGDLFGDNSIGGSVSWSAVSSSDWVSPGATLSGFVIESPHAPSPNYSMWETVTDLDGETGGDTGYVSGLTLGPRVPEPATTALFLCGLAGLAARRRLRQGQ